ncbi:MAG TPA: amidase family protein, partial [Chthoniobacterales bacterium]|nr:amidase family protein [Chthoniobacterales bacterium]
MKRSLFTLAVAAALLTARSPAFASESNNAPAEAESHSRGVTLRFDLLETTIPQIHAGLRSGVISVERLSEMYLKRIEAFDDAGPGINAYLHVNDDVEKQAAVLDKVLRAAPKVLTNDALRRRLPLYGIPVLLKDNIDTADMPTTAGSVALEGSIPPDDAFITK